MRQQAIIVLGLFGLAAGYVAAQAMYSQVGDIAIGAGPENKPAQWDYSLADSAGKRLYVSHSTEVVVIDTATDKVIGRIGDTPGVHGIAVGAGKVFTSNGRENKVSVVDPKTLATISKIDTGGANPDAITFDAKRNEVWVFNHTGMSATGINAATGAVIATVPLTGTAETGQSDGAGKVYVNIEDKSHVDVIDVAQKKVVASWPVDPASEPTGMALDAATHRLFVGGGKALVMMDATSGKVLTSVPICNGTDATWYDAASKLAFVSCREGKVTIAKVTGDTMSVVQTLDTSAGSRTMTLDAGTHRIYLTAAKPASGGGRGYDPASFHVLVYGPK